MGFAIAVVAGFIQLNANIFSLVYLFLMCHSLSLRPSFIFRNSFIILLNYYFVIHILSYPLNFPICELSPHY